ncbi:MAG: response regulator, partial [Clostridia bacterium]|nr:response regulator [Clostridia bacterium]
MRIAICDDAKEFRAELERKIKDSGLIPDAVFENYSSGEELLSALERKEAFSIIFLDVEMSGINGIQTARKIREHNK